ncbi:MAG: prepilin-type N-terminal cleavage/methylation domain-containing protein [Candidatus Saccharibacteria bacterium]|nr:prepilin-type N-terminal cleavage/methylation domain-containing protein [Candidatus Saccharibacteria bacterium]
MSKQKGFTIVELMIATTVFSVILLIMSAGLIYIGKVYYRTVAQNKVQETSRAIMDSVAQSIQFSGGDVTVSDPNGKATCVGNIKYFKTENVIVNSGSDGLQRSNGATSCSNSVGSDSEQLIPEGMFLRDFEVSQIGDSDLYTIHVQVVSVPGDELVNLADGSSELFDGTNCKTGPGSEYCATSRLETTVKKRL